jgi:LPS-assembly protein
MHLRADAINYDYNNERVVAIGRVQMYYKGSSVDADRVVYDQKTKRLRAEGNAIITQADGRIVHGEILDLNDDYRDGFVDSLRLEAPDRSSRTMRCHKPSGVRSRISTCR